MILSAKKLTISNNTHTKNINIKFRLIRCLSRLLFFSRTIANSYLNEAVKDTIPVNANSTPTIPKSSGEYNLEIKGDEITPTN